jgi:hypothetical protein
VATSPPKCCASVPKLQGRAPTLPTSTSFNNCFSLVRRTGGVSGPCYFVFRRLEGARVASSFPIWVIGWESSRISHVITLLACLLHALMICCLMYSFGEYLHREDYNPSCWPSPPPRPVHPTIS